MAHTTRPLLQREGAKGCGWGAGWAQLIWVRDSVWKSGTTHPAGCPDGV